MTTITIDRTLLEQAAALLTPALINPYRSPNALYYQRRDCAAAIRAELAKPVEPEFADNSVDYWQQRGYLGSPDEWREACRLFRVRCSPEVSARLHEIADIAEHASKLMKEAEWLYSGDTGDDTFMRRVDAIRKGE